MAGKIKSSTLIEVIISLLLITIGISAGMLSFWRVMDSSVTNQEIIKHIEYHNQCQEKLNNYSFQPTESWQELNIEDLSGQGEQTFSIYNPIVKKQVSLFIQK